MDAILGALTRISNDSALLAELLIFLATVGLAFAILTFGQARGEVKRRASQINEFGKAEQSPNSLRHSSATAMTQLIDYVTKNYVVTNDENMKVLRRRMLQAGIYDGRAVALFFITRVALAVGCAAVIFLLVPMFLRNGGSVFWLLTLTGAIGGYVAPSVYIDRRIAVRKLEHRSGFPDFMDLLVVCADSGLSMEAALERVGREIGDSYPSLSANIHITNLEIRAGRTLGDALERFADRVGLDEARAFVTLINQSIELGSSISDALRVYSDEMRHKRLSRAEEKAYALPVKLSLPMMICIFPTLFVVILLPIFVRLYTGNWTN